MYAGLRSVERDVRRLHTAGNWHEIMFHRSLLGHYHIIGIYMTQFNCGSKTHYRSATVKWIIKVKALPQFSCLHNELNYTEACYRVVEQYLWLSCNGTHTRLGNNPEINLTWNVLRCWRLSNLLAAYWNLILFVWIIVFPSALFINTDDFSCSVGVDDVEAVFRKSYELQGFLPWNALSFISWRNNSRVLKSLNYKVNISWSLTVTTNGSSLHCPSKQCFTTLFLYRQYTCMELVSSLKI